MNEWERFLESRGKEVFDLLESAINYAALCHPDEFFERRDQITQLLFARQQQPRGVNILDDVSEDVPEGHSTTYSSEKPRALEKEKEKESETKFDKEVKLPVPHRVPNKSCRVGSEEANIKKAAVQVAIVTEKFSEKSDKRKITEKTREMIKEEKSMCSGLEVKLEASKRKLQEGYKQFEDAKQKKKIRMIELKNLPREGAVNHIKSCKGGPMNRSHSSCTNEKHSCK